VRERELGLVAVAYPVDGIALLVQAGDHRPPDHRIIFYDQRSHDRSLACGLFIKAGLSR
jgi:rhodanese-related sulfurtransferase